MPGRTRQLWRALTILWPLAADLHATIAAIVVLGVVASLIEGVSLGVIVTLIYALVGGGPAAVIGPLDALKAWTGVGDKVVLVGVLTAMLMSRGAVAGFYALLTAKVSSTVANRTRQQLYANFMQVDYAYVAERGIGSLVTALDWEASFIPEVLNELSIILISACSILVYGIYFVALSWQMAVLAALFAVPIFGTMLLSGRILKLPSERRLASYKAHSEVAIASLEAMRTVRLHHAQAHYVGLESGASNQIARSEVAIARRQGWIRPVRQAGTLLLGMGFVLTTQSLGIGAGALLATMAVLFRLLPHLAMMESQVMLVFANAAAVTNVAETIVATRNQSLGNGTEPYDGDFGEVAFDGVSFAYPGQGAPSLDAMSVRFRRGTLSLIVGPSGSGKTTIVNLLARLADPRDGRVLVDGRDLRSLNRADWLSWTGFAGQDIELLDGTVLDNIRLGRPEIARADVDEALHLAGALDFVERLPQGLDSLVGNRGLRLSGGQRQRIGLARALARRPTLLVLDEAANAVDPLMERSILAAIRRARPELTMVVVTHRGGMADADQVLVVDAGRAGLAEQGMLVS